MKNNQKQNRYKAYERSGQPVLALNSEIMIPDNAPMRLAAQLEELYSVAGTKLEIRAGRYTLCWRGGVEKNV